MGEADTKQQNTKQAEPQKGPSAEDFRALQMQVAQLMEQNALLARQAGGTMLPEDERPAYELTQPWMSPDDVYYPEGIRVVDVLGDIIPNEFMIPLNEPARVRYDQYMSELPVPGRQPSLSEMIEATAQALRAMGPNAAGVDVAVAVTQALTQRQGAAARRPSMNEPPLRSSMNSAVPLMSNTRITGGGASSKPAPKRTSQVGVAPAPQAHVTGGVATPPLAHLPA